LSLRPEHLKRYKDFAVLLFKYGRRDLVARAGLNDLLPEEAEAEEERIPEARELARDVEKLGPTYIKLAQLLSTRPDIIPPVYAEALARLQDDVEPFSFAEVEKILTGSSAFACRRPSRASIPSRSPPPRSLKCTARSCRVGARLP
jgi:predicted unusual protein kinase regulating ubiquinone biosynthesis (AarF/ABC1/UbiB family)